MSLPDVVRAELSRQDDLIHARQLRAAGVSRNRVLRWVRDGLLEHVMTRVYRTPGAALSERQMLRAASLWAGPRGALSFNSAAWVWGMEGFTAAPVHISVPHRPRPPTAPFPIVVHAGTRFGEYDATMRRGLRVTSGHRTMLDLASVLDDRAFERAVDEALRVEATTKYFLEKVLKYKTRPGQTGIPKLRALIERRGDTLVRTGSPLETNFLVLFAEQKLPRPVLQREFPEIDALKRDRKVDFAWIAQRLAVEIDSFKYHRTRSAWANDIAKHNALVAAGWRVLRLTAEHLRDPAETAALIRRALNARR